MIETAMAHAPLRFIEESFDSEIVASLWPLESKGSNESYDARF